MAVTNAVGSSKSAVDISPCMPVGNCMVDITNLTAEKCQSLEHKNFRLPDRLQIQRQCLFLLVTVKKLLVKNGQKSFSSFRHFSVLHM